MESCLQLTDGAIDQSRIDLRFYSGGREEGDDVCVVLMALFGHNDDVSLKLPDTAFDS